MDFMIGLATGFLACLFLNWLLKPRQSYSFEDDRADNTIGNCDNNTGIVTQGQKGDNAF